LTKNLLFSATEKGVRECQEKKTVRATASGSSGPDKSQARHESSGNRMILSQEIKTILLFLIKIKIRILSSHSNCVFSSKIYSWHHFSTRVEYLTQLWEEILTEDHHTDQRSLDIVQYDDSI